MAPFPSFSQRASGTGGPSSSSASSTTNNLIFPSFLLPSVPFRRPVRAQPADQRPTLTDASATDAEPGAKYLAGNTSTLHCARCSADLCHTSQIISKGFTGRHGRAYLISPPATSTTLPNTLLHPPTPRHLVTGLHTVSDVSCIFCSSVLGWKYVAAEEEAQAYKVGKFILETKRVRGGVGWEGRWDDGGGDSPPAAAAIEFDSEDEDECDDLFAGIWTAEGARRRRKAARLPPR